MNLMRVRRAAPFVVVAWRRVLVLLLRLAGVLLLVTWERTGCLVGGLLRAMEGLCILVRLTRWLLRRLRWLGRLLLTSVRTNTLIRLDFPLKTQQQFKAYSQNLPLLRCVKQ
jgi:hypothetical protein